MVIKEYGYEYDAELDKDLFERTFNKNTFGFINGAYALRSGRDAIKTIAREFEPCVALLPALSCDSMVLPFKMCGHQLAFYKYRENLSIDLSNLYSLLQENKSKTILFLYMDYFGIKAISDSELFRLKKTNKNVLFIHDSTHTFLNCKETNFKSDFILASARKWINIPDGGLLWCNRQLNNQSFTNDTSFAYKRLEAQQLRHSFFNTGDKTLKTQYRAIFSTVSDIIDSDPTPSRMTSYSFELLKKADFETIKKTRRNNASVLINILSSNQRIKVLQTSSNISDLYVPFLVGNRNDIQDKLNKIGIFNTIIWPISKEQKEACANAKYIEEHMLAAPCDQRYTIDDMKYIGQEIVRVIDEE